MIPVKILEYQIEEGKLSEENAIAHLKQQFPDKIVVLGTHTVDRVCRSTNIATSVVDNAAVIFKVKSKHVHRDSGHAGLYRGTNFNQERWIWVLEPGAQVQTQYGSA